MKVLENDTHKCVRSENYNYDFDKKTGHFARWGKTFEEDPEAGPPEIADIEISTICNGLGTPCRFCYKSNTNVGKNMSLETFKEVLHKLPKTVTQVAFGIGDVDANPDLWSIMEYCRNNSYNQVVPNITINGHNLTDEYARRLSELCGAVAVSRYSPKRVCYDAVARLTDLGMKQVNIHQLVSKETIKICLETIEDVKKDPRLENLNAVVFLTLKPKGKRNTLNLVTDDDYAEIIKTCVDTGINFGFDSCSANRFLRVAKKLGGKYDQPPFQTCAEPCESSLFSSYINVDGNFFPCSFAEKEPGWEEGIDVTKCEDFAKDVWSHPKTEQFRDKLQAQCRECALFNL